MTGFPQELDAALGDRYAVVREIGRGGMATVYLAEDLKHRRQVAVKVLHPELASILGRARFLREIEIAASLSHPGIIPLYDSGVTDGVTFYVMPFVEGETLRERLDREPQLPLETALQITGEVGAALAYAHVHGFVHRDIKPANILLSSGRALVADFGIARAITAAAGEQITTSGLAVGTPAYMSPEQASAKDPVDQRADIYALGCVVYEALAGEPPFTGATAQAVLAQHRLEPPPSLEVVRPGVGRAVQHVVEKALAKAPADRWQTVTAFVEALEKAALAPESGEYAPTRGGVRRRWWKAGAAAAAVVMAAGALALWPPWPRPLRLDSNKVAGFPLRALGGVAKDVAEQVYTVIENALVHTDPLRWVPGERWLARGGAEPAAVSADMASSVARRQGARYWLTGTVTSTRDSMSVALEVYDARGDSLVDREVQTGSASVAAYTLGLRAVNALLPKIVGRSTHVDQELLAGFAPRAVVHWLAGEQAYREARYDSALSQYEQALALDSGMLFAALKGAMSAAWSMDAAGYAQAGRLVRLALAHEERLPRRNRAFAHGLAFLIVGDGDSALAWFHRASEADAGWSEAWYGVGEAYLHLAPSGTAQDSLARDAFSQALAQDSDFAPVAFHLAELALLDNDRRGADSLLRLHARLSRDTAQLVTLDILRACIRNGPTTLAWAALAAMYPEEVLDAARLMAAGGRFPECAGAGFEAVLRAAAADPVSGRAWSAVVALHHLTVARGDTARAREFVDSVVAAGGRIGVGAMGLTILDAVAGVAPDGRAAPALALLTAPRSDTVAFLAWVGEWAAHVGDLVRLDSVAAALARRARGSRGGVAESYAGAMAAWGELERGDTTAAMARFGALRRVAGVSAFAFDYWPSLPRERLVYAQLLAARSENRRAIEVAASFDRGLSLVDLVFLPASLELRRDASTAIGERGAAREYVARLRRLQPPIE